MIAVVYTNAFFTGMFHRRSRPALVLGAVAWLGACQDGGGPDGPASIAEIAGNNQAGLAGEPLGQPLVVQVDDASGNGAANVTVIWAVAEGGGSLGAASVRTDPEGRAEVSWTLGPTAGANNNRVTASVTGLAGSPVIFTASATPNATISGTVTVTSGLLPTPLGRGVVARTVATKRGLLTAGSGPPSTVNPAASPTALRFTPDELIVTFRPAVLGAPPIGSRALAVPAAARHAAATMRSLLTRHTVAGRAVISGVSPAIAAARIRVPDPARLAEVAAELRRDAAVASVERNAFVAADGTLVEQALAATSTPDDGYYPYQAWHYGMIDLPEAWTITTGSPAVLVAVVANGIRFDHPDVAPNLTSDGFDFVSSLRLPVCGSATDSIDNAADGDGYDIDPTQPSEYTFADCATARSTGLFGLGLAGTIGAIGNNGTGVAGVNWTVRIRPVRVLGSANVGTDYDVAQGIIYAAGLPADNGAGGTVQATSGAKVIQLGFASPEDVVLANAIVAAHNAGALLVGSGTTGPGYPGAYPEVLSVSGLLPDGQPAFYSGASATIDVAAPGGDWAFGSDFGVVSTGWNFQNTAPFYTSWRGPDMAPAHVVGVAALLLAQNPALTRDQLRSRLTDFAVDAGAPGRDDVYGNGIVNARNSLTQSLAPPQALYVRLYDAATGAVQETVAARPDGSYAFSNVPDGRYHVFAGQDASGDQGIGVPGRRWGGFGGSVAPAPVAVSGAGTYAATFTIGFPHEAGPNNSIATANLLPTGAYLHAQVTARGVPDYFRVLVPASGQYTFETSAWDGACGFALEEDTILSLRDASGIEITSNDDIDFSNGNYCSRVTAFLTSGTYFVVVEGFLGARYRVSARAGG